MLAGGFSLGPSERRMLALYFALDTVWEGVEDAIRDMVNPAALRAMVTSMIGVALVMLVAPEPITKVIAIALTASLIAYLGTGPVWNLGQGFLRLLDESRDAAGLADLERAGHRFGKVLGDNGARVLGIVALSALGGKSAMAAQGPKMPGFAQAASRAQLEGGLPAIGRAGWGGSGDLDFVGWGAERDARTDGGRGGRDGRRRGRWGCGGSCRGNPG